MNDSFDHEVNKPSRNERFFRQIQLKCKTQKLLQKLGSELQKKKWMDHNFRKTQGLKVLYSCHGYGGQCGMCKGTREEKKIANIDFIAQTVSGSLREWYIVNWAKTLNLFQENTQPL